MTDGALARTNAASDRHLAAIEKGRVEVPAGTSRDIALVPRAGRYKLECGHAFHKLFGMTGEIRVD